MNFGEAVERLVSRIHRPDKVEDAGDAVNRAIAVFATANFFTDLAETQITLAAQEYMQTVSVVTAPFVRFRKISYIRPTGFSTYIVWKDPSRIFVAGSEQVNVWYRAGNNLKFKLSALQETAQVGYYQYHALLEEDEDTDWMLDMMWPAVQAYCLAELFQEIGQDADADRFTRRWPLLLQTFKEDLGDGVSHA